MVYKLLPLLLSRCIQAKEAHTRALVSRAAACFWIVVWAEEGK